MTHRENLAAAYQSIEDAERSLAIGRDYLHNQWRVFGSTMAEYRRAHGLTLRQVAAGAGTSVAYVHDVEKGRRGPSGKVIDALKKLGRKNA